MPTKVHLVEAMVFSSSHVWMWELDYKASWAPKNWCFWPVLLEKTLESPLDCKSIKPVNPKGNHSWIFIERTDAEAEVPILWPPGEKNWLIGKDPDAGKDWRQEGKGMTGWDGWTASLTQWTLQRVRHDAVTKLNWYIYACFELERCAQRMMKTCQKDTRAGLEILLLAQIWGNLSTKIIKDRN